MQCCAKAKAGNRTVAIRTAENADVWFWPYVKRSGIASCWDWQGSSTSKGYGQTYILREKKLLAHRVSFFVTHGKWPTNILRHTCDNRLCVNPSHLLDGTALENAQDASERGRLRSGEGHPCAKLTAKDVAAIRQSTSPHKALARELGVHHATIIKARNKDTWAKV